MNRVPKLLATLLTITACTSGIETVSLGGRGEFVVCTDEVDGRTGTRRG